MITKKSGHSDLLPLYLLIEDEGMRMKKIF